MNNVNAKTTNVINRADDLQAIETLNPAIAALKQNEIQALSDWEMVLVGGGDTVVCW